MLVFHTVNRESGRFLVLCGEGSGSSSNCLWGKNIFLGMYSPRLPHGKCTAVNVLSIHLSLIFLNNYK